MGVAAAAAAVAASGALAAGGLAATLQHDHGIPQRAAVAYINAARDAPCPIDYRILAAIGAVETGHGTHGGAHLDDTGEMSTMAVSYAGAQGPMQFMPDTWNRYQTDGDRDGRMDVNDIDDATAAAAAYLCASNIDEDLHDAVYAYNHDDAYVGDVEDRADALPPDDGNPLPSTGSSESSSGGAGRICGVGEWAQPGNDCFGLAQQKAGHLWAVFGDILNRSGAKRLHAVWSKLNGQPAPMPAGQIPTGQQPTGQLVDIAPCANSRGCKLDSGWAPGVERALAEAPMRLTIVSAWRSVDEQVALRERNCGPSSFAVYEMAPSDCSVVTARPGESNHGDGLAVDLAWADGSSSVQCGDEAWEWLQANGGRYGMVNTIGCSDSPHWSKTGN